MENEINVNENSVLTCTHHWMIETPNGKYSNGVCKNCNEVKQFSNYEVVRWRKFNTRKRR